MSRKSSTAQTNTLFNYFQSPKSETKRLVSNHSEKVEDNFKKDTDEAGTSKRNNSRDDDEIKVSTKKKRNRIRVLDDSSEDEDDTSRKQKKIKILNDNSDENDSPNTPKVKKNLKYKIEAGDSDEENGKSKKNLKDYTFQKGKTDLNESQIENHDTKKPKAAPLSEAIKDIHSNWKHNNLDFLKAGQIRDKNKRKPSDPLYDSRTLHVPESFLKNLTPAMRQWWELKSDHMDAVLFFKVGKFYELYHMDAVVGVQQLGFSYMKGDFAHSGFPETAYAKMASTLIEKGFKVARVEQVETPQMMSERCQKQQKVTKFDKVVKREICQVSTKATCIYTAQMPEARNETSYFMYAIALKEDKYGTYRIGVCFVETSMGMIYLSEFNDDKHFSRLLALFAEYPASLILTEKGGTTKAFNELLNTHFRSIRKDTLLSKSQFYTASNTLEKLSMECYFKDKDGNFSWPDFFKQIANDCLPKEECELGIRSLGACMWYLKDSLLDIHVFSMGKFYWYDPLDLTSKEKGEKRDYLIIDAVTISNLDLLGGKGTLQGTLDHCETAFGKRLLQRWICRPLCDYKKIKERQIAVNELFNTPSLLSNAQSVLKNMPDLERQLAKINTYGNKFLADMHPDGRAIFYEAITYSKTKIKDFIKTLRALEKAQEVPNIFADCSSRLLKKITQFDPVGSNIDLEETINFFKGAFNQEEAEKEGKIIPKRGVDADFDQAEENIDDLKIELDKYLKEQSRIFGCKVTYFGSDKKRFQLTIPDNKYKHVTIDYKLEGSKKGCKYYSTVETRQMLQKMLQLESERSKIILDLNRRIFEKFTERYSQIEQVIQCLMMLDVLCSLAQYARGYSHDICVPEIKPFDKPKLLIENGRHPCIPNIDNFVPNDINMGENEDSSLIILTGPNMGGKSTLMRQIAIISVMAQIGSCVPASACQLTLIDRVFTRLGAQDDILQGQSTFYVELSEASCILEHSTQHALVLIDELGRGTSTHDGNAIATAYVKKLVTIGCRTMFSTHYHTLVDHFIDRKDVQLLHMACMVENDEDPTEESVTFLYKIAKGRCPKSYGFNAARLAGLNHKVISRGREVAQELEEENKIRNLFSIIFASNSLNLVHGALSSIVV